VKVLVIQPVGNLMCRICRMSASEAAVPGLSAVVP